MKNYEYTFEDYANDILPKRLEMMESLLKNPFKIKTLFAKGTGERGVIKKLGRVTDFKGIYAFLNEGKVMYVGTSEKVVNRLTYHIKGHTKYQAHIAWEIAKARNLYLNKKLQIPDLAKAKKILHQMQIVFMEITSPTERYLMEIYASMKYDCGFNFYETRE